MPKFLVSVDEIFHYRISQLNFLLQFMQEQYPLINPAQQLLSTAEQHYYQYLQQYEQDEISTKVYEALIKKLTEPVINTYRVLHFTKSKQARENLFNNIQLTDHPLRQVILPFLKAWQQR